jgi:hypothetical protein
MQSHGQLTDRRRFANILIHDRQQRPHHVNPGFDRSHPRRRHPDSSPDGGARRPRLRDGDIRALHGRRFAGGEVVVLDQFADLIYLATEADE